MAAGEREDPVVLTNAGWSFEAFGSLSYYWSPSQGLAQPDPPFYDILQLDSTKFRQHSREAIFRAYREKLLEYKGDAKSTKLLCDAYRTLSNTHKRSVFEQSNCSKNGKLKHLGLLCVHLNRPKPVPPDVALDENAPEEE